MVRMQKNTGQKIWKKSLKIIPGGTMLFSKNPDLYLPGYWPVYFSKAKKCFIWDLDKKKYLDISMMGVGTNILGYANKEVNHNVKKVINNGNISTLNSLEEVLLAEKLIKIHPWAHNAKFTRSGGEASAVALRISRAATKKNNVAICGYHGWHDWYLAANLKNKNNLNNLLFKDLLINGVNNKLANTTFTFEYNNFDSLKKVVQKNNIGTIFMEVERDEKLKIDFLKKVRKYATKKKIVLIFDECTSGFRETYGGLHMRYKIYPDIAIFGKTIGNGYPINPIIGRKSIMKYAKTSFISSTFWTERVGYAAALSTINIIEKKKKLKKIIKKGTYIKEKWQALSKKYNIDISIYGADSIPKFKFNSKNHLYYKTYLTQEFLKVRILANTTIYISIEHTDIILKKYLLILEKIFKKINFFNKNNIDIKKKIIGKVAIAGMRDSNT